MIALIQGVITLIVLILQQIIKANDTQTKAREEKIKEIKDAIKAGDTSAITAALSRMR